MTLARIRQLALLLPLAFGAAISEACAAPADDGGIVAPPGRVATSLTVVPDTVRLGLGDSVQFASTVRFSDGTSEPYAASYRVIGGAAVAAGLFRAPRTAGRHRVAAECACGGKNVADTAEVSVTGFANEPPGGFTRVAEHSFDDLPRRTAVAGTQYAAPGGYWETWGARTVRVVDDATAPAAGGKVAEITWPRGLDDGEQNGTGILARFDRDYKELYVSFRFKILGGTFENQAVGTKLLGYVGYGGYERMNQFYWMLKENSYWTPTGSWGLDGPGGVRAGPFQLESRVSVFYTDHLTDGRNPNTRAVQYLSNNQGTGNTVRLGQWTHMEAHFRLNTKNADGTYNRDGVIRQWIDGRLVQSFTNVDWLTSKTAPLGDHGFWGLNFDPIWGGNSNMIKSRDDRMYLDHVYVSGVRQ
jgi:hypothetical protein